MSQKCAWLVPFLAAMVLVFGCGKGPRLVTVNGSVKMDGQPLADASVQFVFTQYPRSANGRTDSEGKFTLSYNNRAGAPIGACKVIISKVRPPGDETSGSKNLVPARYNSNSQLQYEITKKEKNFDFDLNSEPDAGGAAPPVPPANDEDSESELPPSGNDQKRKPQAPPDKGRGREEESDLGDDDGGL